MKFGVDYYPEHWDRSEWRAQAELMKKPDLTLCAWQNLHGAGWSRTRASLILNGSMK